MKNNLVVVSIALIAVCVGPVSCSSTHEDEGVSLNSLSDIDEWDGLTESDRLAVSMAVAELLPEFAFLRVQSFACADEHHAVAIFGHALTGMEFSLIPGGQFACGSSDDEPGRRWNESEELVSRVRPFLMSRTEVTQRVWASAGFESRATKLGRDLPIVDIHASQMEEFCDQLGLSLPTSVEWEYACRAGSNSPWFVGSDPSDLHFYAWFDENSNGGLQRVATKRANAFGLFDMAGNVMEWCDSEVHLRVNGSLSFAGFDVRGGAFGDDADRLRSAAREHVHWGAFAGHLGFRPVKRLRLSHAP